MLSAYAANLMAPPDLSKAVYVIYCLVTLFALCVVWDFEEQTS